MASELRPFTAQTRGGKTPVKPTETFFFQCIEAAITNGGDVDDDEALFAYCKYLAELMNIKVPCREWLKSVRDEIANKGLME
jgi:hypothetical protein